MNRDNIIRLAREAGMERVVKVHSDGTRTIELPHPALLERFAALVAAAEREACAKVCDEEVERHAQASRYGLVAGICAAAIRARGEV